MNSARPYSVNRTTLYRQQRKLQAHGVLGVVDGKRGPRGPHRFTAEKRHRVAELLDAGGSIRHAAEQVGVTEGTIRHALRRGELRQTPPRPRRRRAANPQRAGGARRGRRGRSAARRARPGAAGPVDGSGPAVRCGGGGARGRGVAGPAGRAQPRAAGRGATGLRRPEERVLRPAGHAALPDLHGAAAHSHAGAAAGAAARGTGDPARARPGPRGQDAAAQTRGVGGPPPSHAVQSTTGRALGARPRGRRGTALRRWSCAAVPRHDPHAAGGVRDAAPTLHAGDHRPLGAAAGCPAAVRRHGPRQRRSPRDAAARDPARGAPAGGRASGHALLRPRGLEPEVLPRVSSAGL